MTNALRAFLLPLLCLTLFATSAAADCAWVLWSRFSSGSRDEVLGEWTNTNFANVYPTYAACQAKITALTTIPEPGSLGDWLHWARSLGQYYPGQRNMDLFHMKEGDVHLTRDDSSATVVLKDTSTTWRCLPDTMDPRGTKK